MRKYKGLFRIAFAATLFSRSGSQRLFQAAELKTMLAGNKFCSDEEVIAEAEVYFETKDKSLAATCLAAKIVRLFLNATILNNKIK